MSNKYLLLPNTLDDVGVSILLVGGSGVFDGPDAGIGVLICLNAEGIYIWVMDRQLDNNKITCIDEGAFRHLKDLEIL
nr:unnamed protein product [Callosobruchus chinensis]